MTSSDGIDASPAKRRKLDCARVCKSADICTASNSLSRSISPPISRRKIPVRIASSLLASASTWSFDDIPEKTSKNLPSQQELEPEQTDQSITGISIGFEKEQDNAIAASKIKYIASPFQLTKICDLAPYQNIDTIELKDILGDPMIKECWNFNFLFDPDFVMQQFDEDVRNIVQVKIIHGFWKREDERRINLMETTERYSNVELISAYLPDPYGTHHSKMLILLRHDDCAQVVIHTANMIPKDWTNMTQAVWRSPLLPLRTPTAVRCAQYRIGSGERFKLDLLRYLDNYGKRLRILSDQLVHYDFSAIRAAFIGSTPSKQIVNNAVPQTQTSFGWPGLQEILDCVPTTPRRDSKKPPNIIIQVSSVATLGATPTWLSNFQAVLARSHTPQRPLSKPNPDFKIIFPTPEEVRTSLDGYCSGGSIHMKVQSLQQQKQLQYLRPLLCHWKRSSSVPIPLTIVGKEAHRGLAAPHIKTYIRFSDDTYENIDWALLTSANLSKQAWGDVVNKQGQVRIQSYETGVLLWPELFAEPGNDIRMVPVFGKDMPENGHVPTGNSTQPCDTNIAEIHDGDREDEETGDKSQGLVIGNKMGDTSENAHRQTEPKEFVNKSKALIQSSDKVRTLVGLRMPYDLPLSSYIPSEEPWCATERYTTPDWMGRAWGG